MARLPLALAHPFGTGYVLGLVLVPLAVVFAVLAGPTAGWLAFAALAVGAAWQGPFTARRLAGVAAGVGTLVVSGFTLVAAAGF